MKYILVIDEGTTGTRALIYDKEFNIISQNYMEFTQYTPTEDRVEHDALEIYDKSIEMCKKTLSDANLTGADIDSIGITNQRATCVVWDKETGKPLYNAIVWQDNRTATRCQEIEKTEWGKKCKEKTGWTVAPVFSSLMVEWILKNVDGVKEKFDEGKALFGTIDTWLIWKLTNGKTHAISYSNASVTGSLDLTTGTWYKEFLDFLNIPVSIYPTLMEDSGNFGSTYDELFGVPIPITSAVADQHAALFAQGCRKEGMAKLTNGTGSFLDVNIGEKCTIIDGGISTVIAWKINGKIQYAMEGYAATTGSAIQWLRDGLGIISKSSESETLARSVTDTNGLYFVPALTGLGAPYWDSFARGLIIGINRGTTKAHLCRATLESIAFSIMDIAEQIEKSSSKKITDISIDGGASQNNLLAQMLSDIVLSNIHRPSSVEATSLGAAQLAGLSTGYWNESDFDEKIKFELNVSPEISPKLRQEKCEKWHDAIKRSMSWQKVSE